MSSSFNLNYAGAGQSSTSHADPRHASDSDSNPVKDWSRCSDVRLKEILKLFRGAFCDVELRNVQNPNIYKFFLKMTSKGWAMQSGCSSCAYQVRYETGRIIRSCRPPETSSLLQNRCNKGGCQFARLADGANRDLCPLT